MKTESKNIIVQEKKFSCNGAFVVNKDMMNQNDGLPDTLMIEGVANAFLDASGQMFIDHSGEAVLPHSMNLDIYKSNPIILFNHDRDEPIGKAVEVSADSSGIKIKAEIYKALCDETFAAIYYGVLKTFSIGFKCNKWVYDSTNDCYLATDTTLLETSIVSIPDNALSTFSVVKSEDGSTNFSVKSLDFDAPVREKDAEVIEESAITTDSDLEDTKSILERIIKLEEQLTVQETSVPTEEKLNPAAELSLEVAAEFILQAASNTDQLDSLLAFHDAFSNQLNTAVNAALQS